jgi:hypothetical protein
MATGRVPTTANSPLTAKGDLFGYSTTPARLAVGNNGDTLLADSSTSTGLRWSPAPSTGNPVINSAFQVWQRGTSFTTNASTYTADRWVGYRGTTGMTVSRQLTSDSTNLPNIQYCARVQRDAGNTSTGSLQFGQMFETVNSIPYAGKTVTVSFYGRKGANFSASQLDYYIITGTGTDQNYFTAYTGSAFNGAAAALTTTWVRYSATFTLSSTMTEMAILFAPTMSGTAGAADYYEVTGVQLDIGSVALPFRTYAGTLQGELAACQRYYQKSYNQGTAPATNTTDGLVGTLAVGTDRLLGIRYAVVMRTAPTVTIYSSNGTSGKVTTFGGTDAGGSVIGDLIGDAGYRSLYTATSVTTSTAYSYHYTLSAEL